MSQGNTTSQSNLHTDVDMTDNQHPQLPPIHNSVAGTLPVTKTDASPQTKAWHKGYSTSTEALRMLQTPLPSHLSPRQILKNHPDRLFYNNLLKVALHYNNNTIAAHLLGVTAAVVAVSYRVNTAIKWISFVYNIDDQVFRTAFNRERRLQGVYHRPQEDKCDETVLAINIAKITEAMAWIKEGGPRSSLATATLKKVDQTARITRKAPAMPAPLIYCCPHTACGKRYSKVSMLNQHILSKHSQNSQGLLQDVKTQKPFQCPGTMDGVPCPERLHTRQDRWQHICSKHGADEAERERLLEVHFTFCL